MSCLIRNDQHMRAHRRSKGRLHTPALKEICQTRAERLLQWHAKNRNENILFMDKKIFTTEEQYNHQKNKICTQTSHEVKKSVPRVQRGHHPFCVMVCWGGVLSGGDTSSFLQERGETGAQVYQDDVLQGTVKHLSTTLFSGQEWIFQQDSAPAHKAKTTQEWLRRNVLAFFSAENSPSGSLDLKPPGL